LFRFAISVTARRCSAALIAASPRNQAPRSTGLARDPLVQKAQFGCTLALWSPKSGKKKSKEPAHGARDVKADRRRHRPTLRLQNAVAVLGTAARERQSRSLLQAIRRTMWCTSNGYDGPARSEPRSARLIRAETATCVATLPPDNSRTAATFCWRLRGRILCGGPR